MSEHPTYKTGLLPTDPGKPILEIDRALTGVTLPPSEDRYTGVTFGLDNNDVFGICVAPETLVLTGDLRWVPAATVESGDCLLGFDEYPQSSHSAGRRYRESQVEHARIITRPCYELEFDDGTTIVCSSEHRWLTRSTVQGELKTQRWCETKDLKCGPKRQSRIVKSFDVWGEDRSYEAGYLAGAFDGEGNLELTRHGAYANRMCFTQRENEMLARVEAYLEAGGYAYSSGRKAVGVGLRVDGSLRDPVRRVTVDGRSNWLRLMGTVRPARLLPKLDLDRLGRIDGGVVGLVRKTFVGERYVVALTTSTRTYFAEGLASHNCGPTAVDNNRRSTSKVATGVQRTAPQSAVDELYRLSGNPNFDPSVEGGVEDNGVEMGTMLDALLAHGLSGDKPVAFGRAKATDDAAIERLVATFGGVLFAVDLLEAQQEQTDAHPPVWDFEKSGQWGGHAIYCGKYRVEQTVSGLTVLEAPVISWAKEVGTTDNFRKRQLEEVWVVIWPWHLQHPAFLAGVDVAELAVAFKELTGKSLPIPTPSSPPPVPSGNVDELLWEHLQHWALDERHVGDNKKAASAAREWAAAKGFIG